MFQLGPSYSQLLSASAGATAWTSLVCFQPQYPCVLVRLPPHPQAKQLVWQSHGDEPMILHTVCSLIQFSCDPVSVMAQPTIFHMLSQLSLVGTLAEPCQAALLFLAFLCIGRWWLIPNPSSDHNMGRCISFAPKGPLISLL